MTPEDIIRVLGLAPHPEGGHYVETWRDTPADGSRGSGTAIYFLLRAGEVSRWHRIDAAEIWHWYAGAPLWLHLSESGGPARTIRLCPDLAAGGRPQVIVPVGAWQSAECTGAWTLVGVTVSPAFEFSGFEMAPPSWRPGDSPP